MIDIKVGDRVWTICQSIEVDAYGTHYPSEPWEVQITSVANGRIKGSIILRDGGIDTDDDAAIETHSPHRLFRTETEAIQGYRFATSEYLNMIIDQTNHLLSIIEDHQHANGNLCITELANSLPWRELRERVDLIQHLANAEPQA